MSTEIKKKIQETIQQFNSGNLAKNAIALFNCLGYNTDRQSPLSKPTFDAFKDSFIGGGRRFNEEKACVKSWKNVDLLFQLTKDEVSQQNSLFDTKRVDRTIIETYLFFAIELTPGTYSRTAFSQITREVNKLFPMPVMILFKVDSSLTLSVINRRLHKRDESKDVLEKVTLIKDISIENPHRAHIEILFDLSFAELLRIHNFTNFVELHDAWQKTLDIKELNKRFYLELSNWYFWAKDKVFFPADVEKDEEKRNSINLIRLITRIIFIWFIKEKNLVSEDIFDRKKLQTWLKEFNRNTKSSTFYTAILQNLFFGTLNQKMEERTFAKDGKLEDNINEYGVKNLFRYADQFTISEKEALALFANIPFLNGGLFDCLDKPDDSGKILYSDGFSRNPKKRAFVPDYLFFGAEQDCDLNEIYGTHDKHYKVKGIIDILTSYKFTITENTPLEEEVALDPELLGKVFENLLASYNPETQTTARKQTGSFYTPREIVDYMVDESLVAYFKSVLLGKSSVFLEVGRSQTSMFGNEVRTGQLALNEKISGSQWAGKEDELDKQLRELLSYTTEMHRFGDYDVEVLINAIDSCKILDPACGSGAFPMGILHKLVLVLHKLDPKNEKWKKRQIQKTKSVDDAELRDKMIEGIEEAFRNNELDYGRKLFLIENCIYGVDIQPIAVQIAKLRFFISLIIDQNKRVAKDNLGVRSLPNLETKFVAANTLISLDKPQQQRLHNVEIDDLENELKAVRHDYFSARTRKSKILCQKCDKELRIKIAKLLEDDGWGHKSALQVAQFDPYDQHISAGFFDLEWMFGFKQGEGFDIVIGNPPYLNVELVSPAEKEYYANHYETFYKRYDVFGLFYEISLKTLAKSGGSVAFIIPQQIANNLSYKKLREYILSNQWLREVFYLGDKVFEAANNDVCVLFLQKKRNDSIRLINALDLSNRITATVPHNHFEQYGNVISFSSDDHGEEIIGKIFSGKRWRIKDSFLVFQGIVTGNNDAFLPPADLISGSHIEKSLLHPILLGRDFEKYYIRSVERRIIYVDGDTPISKYPNTEKWLLQFRSDLKKRRECIRGVIPWYSLQWPRNKADLEHTPKILVQRTRNPRLSTRIVATIDEEGLFGMESVIFLKPTTKSAPTHFLLAVLNSSIINYLYATKFLNVAVKGEYLKETPIPEATKLQQDEITALSKEILSLKSKKPDTNTSSIENKIDRLVAGLYGITDKELSTIHTR